VFFQVGWFWSLALTSDPTTTARRDWYAFFETGRRFVAGHLDAIYPRAFEGAYFWLHPPYCIYLTVPLAFLPERWAYATCAAAELVALLVALLILSSVFAQRERFLTAALIVLASMPFNTMIATGQTSGVLALILATALWAWKNDEPFIAGLALSALLVKPTFAIVFPPLCLITRQWRVLTGIVLGSMVLLLSSLPLGIDTWRAYADTSSRYLAFVLSGSHTMWKQLTVYAFILTAPGLRNLSRSWTTAIWLVTLVPLVALTVATWWRRWNSAETQRPRLFGLAVLLAVCANVYVFFYDGVLLLFPGIAWWVDRDQYVSRRTHALIGACILLVFVTGHVTMFLTDTTVAWTGPLLVVWLVAEGFDLLRAPGPETPV
jgi:hypothetical protein